MSTEVPKKNKIVNAKYQFIMKNIISIIVFVHYLYPIR